MKILITGAVGFIGFHLSSKLSENRNNHILGIDSINSYYSKKIKFIRLKKIIKEQKFYF